MTTIVQQIDTQGPAVVERITTQFADLACSEENARKLLDALHTGQAVNLTATVNGEQKSLSFRPTGGNLGYGEAYIALALAAEALRNAGVTGCAAPEQWQAALLGGPLQAAGTSRTSTSSVATASSTSNFPGILTLRSQGQGWGQIAQTTNVQLGQVVSSARSSLNISGDSTLSPTGRSSSEMSPSRSSTDTSGSTSGTSATGTTGTTGTTSTTSGTNSDTSTTSTGTSTTGSTSTPSTTVSPGGEYATPGISGQSSTSTSTDSGPPYGATKGKGKAKGYGKAKGQSDRDDDKKRDDDRTPSSTNPSSSRP